MSTRFDAIASLFDLVEPMLTEFDDYRIDGALKAARKQHAAAPDMLAALKEAQRMVGAYVLLLERGGNETDATHARYVERQIAETIAKAEGAA